jgi:hypothetical protein
MSPNEAADKLLRISRHCRAKWGQAIIERRMDEWRDWRKADLTFQALWHLVSYCG